MPDSNENSVVRSAGKDEATASITLTELGLYRGELVRLAYRLLWNREDAEDVVHDAIIAAYQNRNQLRKRDKLAGWLRSIVVRRSRDLIRRSRLRLASQVRLANEARSDAHQDVAIEREEGHAVLRRAIVQLPERQRAALVLRDLEQLGYGETARLMEISESTVRVLVRNARESLRERLKGK